MDILLFLASGVSRETLGQDVASITNATLEERWQRHTDSNFYRPSDGLNRTDRRVERLQCFLKLLKGYSDTYLALRRPVSTTYEDLFYLAQQVEEEVKMTIDHPFFAPFIRQLRAETEQLCKPVDLIEMEYSLGDLAAQSCDLIQCVVWHSLNSAKHPVGFDLLPAMASSSGIDRIDVCTLNHDLLIEAVLRRAGVNYADGFGEPEPDIRWFKPETYDDRSKRVRLYKLHGSIDLWRWDRNDSGKYEYGLLPSGLSELDCKGGSEIEPRPTFLTGTYNKMLDYRHGIFGTVHNRFFQLLQEHSSIVMSGYGWNDRGINGWLSEWFSRSPRNRLVLLHRTPEELRNNSKSNMWYRYDDLVKAGQLIPIRKWFSEASIDEVLGAFRGGN